MALQDWTNDQLQQAWAQGFEDRVKSGKAKGQIKLKAIRFCDKVLQEAQRRGVALVTPSQYQ